MHHPNRTICRSAAGLLAVGALTISLAACGDDSVEPIGQPSDVTEPGTAAPDTAAPDTAGPGTVAPEPTEPGTGVGTGYDHPTGADEVVIEIEQTGGFLPIESVFARTPELVVTGDGRRFSPGAQIAIYPGPLLPAVEVADIGEDGVQQLLALADDHGLFGELDLEGGELVADAPTTVVTIVVNGTTYEHSAYALGIGGGPGEDESADRAALSEFVEAVRAATVSGEPAELFAPEAYLIAAYPATDLSGFELEPTVVEWPADAEVRLADVGDCAEIPAELGDALFADADQLTFFTDAGVTYQVAVKPVFPGVDC